MDIFPRCRLATLCYCLSAKKRPRFANSAAHRCQSCVLRWAMPAYAGLYPALSFAMLPPRSHVSPKHCCPIYSSDHPSPSLRMALLSLPVLTVCWGRRNAYRSAAAKSRCFIALASISMATVSLLCARSSRSAARFSAFSSDTAYSERGERSTRQGCEGVPEQAIHLAAAITVRPRNPNQQHAKKRRGATPEPSHKTRTERTWTYQNAPIRVQP